MEIEEVDDPSRQSLCYSLTPTVIHNEDVLFCVDVDTETQVEIKPTISGGRSLTRLDAMKQAILLFINTKLSINPNHRFAFAVLSKSVSWLRREFTGDAESAAAALEGLSPTSCAQADLTFLFRIAAHESKKSRAQNRILRVILLYCRSSTRPQHEWLASNKFFTLDVIYLHDKPGLDNCPQDVYCVLLDTLEAISEYEGYIFETGQGQRVLLRYMALLLSHPQQRCPQDHLDLPKSLPKRPLPTEPTSHEDALVSS